MAELRLSLQQEREERVGREQVSKDMVGAVGLWLVGDHDQE